MTSVAPSADITAATPSADSATPQTVEELCAAVGAVKRLYLLEKISHPSLPAPSLMPRIVALGVLFFLLAVWWYWYPVDFGNVLLAFSYALIYSVCALVWCLRTKLRKPAKVAPIKWLVNFDAPSLEPIGQSNKEAIILNRMDYSLGCYAHNGAFQDLTKRSFLVEIRRVKKGPIAELCWLEVPVTESGSVSSDHLSMLDGCVHKLTQRLGIPRSGAPLSAATSLAKK